MMWAEMAVVGVVFPFECSINTDSSRTFHPYAPKNSCKRRDAPQQPQHSFDAQAPLEWPRHGGWWLLLRDMRKGEGGRMQWLSIADAAEREERLLAWRRPYTTLCRCEDCLRVAPNVDANLPTHHPLPTINVPNAEGAALAANHPGSPPSTSDLVADLNHPSNCTCDICVLHGLGHAHPTVATVSSQNSLPTPLALHPPPQPPPG